MPHTAALCVGVSRYQAAVDIFERDVVCSERRGIVVGDVETHDVAEAPAVERTPVQLRIRKRHPGQASGSVRDDEE